MPEQILRRPEVCRRLGVARSTLYELQKRGEFPPPIELSPNCRGWREATVDKYIRDREKRVARARPESLTSFN